MAGKPTNEELVQRVKGLEKEVAERKKAEEALRRNEKRLSRILQEISIPTFVIDKNHKVTHVNRAYENLTGISAHEIIGTRKQWATFYSKARPVMADLIVDNSSEGEIAKYYGGKYRKSAVTDGGYESERLFRDLKKGDTWLFFTASPLKDAQGNITGAIETLQDITERKLAEQGLRKSERRLINFLDFVPYPTVVFSLDGRVFYLNAEFTEVFGWTLEELEGKTIPYAPPGMEQQTSEMIKELLDKKIVLRHETRRLTKDGRILDVVMRAGIYSEGEEEAGGEIVILRDITKEKRIARNNEAILRISMALPGYPDLEDLLDYISSEVKLLLESEGSLIALLDEKKEELFFSGAAYDDSATEKRVKEIRFPIDQLVAGKVIRTGEPIIVPDASGDPGFYKERDRKLGYETRNLLLVPLKSSDHIFGVLCAINKKEGAFDETDVELLNMIAGTVALSIENARFSEELKGAYKEVTSLNRAKDKVINHLSHELKTPVSVLSGSISILTNKLAALPENKWKATIERSKRNLDRIIEIQNQVEDIMRDKDYKAFDLLSLMLDECKDEIETLFAEQVGEGPVIEAIGKRIEETFGAKKIAPERIILGEYVKKRFIVLKPLFSHRQVKVITHLETATSLSMSPDPLQKVVDGLIKNAIENTPDEGKIELIVRKNEDDIILVVRDYGVGIIEDAQRRIFEGFFATQDTMAYSSKRPFDFNAGGKGADLLRMKIFSERYNFKIDMVSSRCKFIPKETDVCPGRISECEFCSNKEDCHQSGGTTFTINFPASSK
ncbi:MAG: PAS domain S-box protein [Deltaproteobacteria bacterium]|nr:PAS domain S-box protein [Deltaproteobacteria bacterium]